MRKVFLTLTILLTLGVNVFAAWTKTVPADNDIRKQAPAQIRANWDAIELGTDPALQITNAKVSASAAIVDTKLATISTAGKVSGSALTSLSSTPSGAGALPIANGGTGATARQAALDGLVGTQTSQSGKALVTDGTNMSLGYPTSLNVASAATGDILYYNGTSWTRLAPGTSGYALKSAGTGSAPVYGQIDLSGTNVTSTLPIANGGTGQTTAQTAIDALVPSQGSNANKFLKTDGTNVSWGTVTQYSPSFASGVASYDSGTSTGDFAISGLGFIPSVITFHATGYNNTYSHGTAISPSTQTCIGYGAATEAYFTNKVINMNFGSGSYSSAITLKSYDASGFTLTITRSGSSTGRTFVVQWTAIK